MVSAALPRGRHRSLIGLVIQAAPAVRKVAARATAQVREHVVTVAAFAGLDYGMFGISAAHHAAGWAVTSVTVLVLDWLVRG